MAGHTYANLLVHVLFSAKGRRPTIRQDFRARLYDYLGGVARQEFGRSLRVGGTANHLHGLILLKPRIAVSDARSSFTS